MSLGKTVVDETSLFDRGSSNFRKFHDAHYNFLCFFYTLKRVSVLYIRTFARGPRPQLKMAVKASQTENSDM
jgi:hypothetical protein